MNGRGMTAAATARNSLRPLSTLFAWVYFGSPLPVTHAGLAPLDQAISVSGGVRRAALTPGLMLTARPGVFCAGEMLNWDAPTGGYLLTACLATGRWAGRAAANWTLADAGSKSRSERR